MNPSNPFHAITPEKAKALAQSEAGQKLLSRLQQTNSADLQQAMAQAAAGNYDQVKKIMSALLTDKDTKSLVEEMRE